MSNYELKGRVLYDKLLVKRADFEEVQPSTIIATPDAAKEIVNLGRVIMTGIGRITKDAQLIPLQVQPGDLVYFGKHCGWDIKIHGQEFVILREDDIVYFEPVQEESQVKDAA